ncbi:50S ribosomal protein L35 [bacterium]|nr:50S ribosomal protein L35 [bacterium]
MPKMKTKSSAKKRFFPIKSGKIKRRKCGLRHGMRNQQTTTKRNLGHTGYVDSASMKAMKVMLPYGTK